MQIYLLYLQLKIYYILNFKTVVTPSNQIHDLIIILSSSEIFLWDRYWKQPAHVAQNGKIHFFFPPGTLQQGQTWEDGCHGPLISSEVWSKINHSRRLHPASYFVHILALNHPAITLIPTYRTIWKYQNFSPPWNSTRSCWPDDKDFNIHKTRMWMKNILYEN